MTFFSPIVFPPFCVLHWWNFFFLFVYVIIYSHTRITHCSVRCRAQYTSLFRDGIFDDSASVNAVLPFFSQWLTRYYAVYANSILAMYGFPSLLTLMPILTVAMDSLPRFNARKQLRERLEEPLELKLPTSVLFGQPESQNMLFMRSNPFSTSASAETKYSEYAFSARGTQYWSTITSERWFFTTLTTGRKEKDPHGMQSRNYTLWYYGW